MNGNAVTCRAVGKAFGERRALTAVDIDVRAGELLGLVGPNGAGKSTLLRSLIGLVEPDTGTIDVLGLDPRQDPVGVRSRVSYLPGETSVYQQMTGRQFLDFALGFYRARQADVLALLQEGFALPLQRRVRTYSAGMKQKLALLATLGPDVDVYLLDEPDRALDASVRFFVRDVLRNLRSRGKTIVLSSHHLSEIESLADRTEFVVGGRLVAEHELQAARTRLARRLRLRLVDGTPLPAALQLLQTEADGMLLVECSDDPLQVLRSLPAHTLLGAEIGITRLEDLYQQLLEPGAGQVGGGTT